MNRARLMGVAMGWGIGLLAFAVALESMVTPAHGTWAHRAQMLAGNLDSWSFTSAYGILRIPFAWLGHNVVLLSLFVFVAIWLLGGAVGRGLPAARRPAGQDAIPAWPWFALVACGFLIYAPDAVPEYNHLSLLLGLVGAVLLLKSLSREDAWIAMGLGLLAGMLMAVKISAGILWSAGIWLWWVGHRRKGWGFGMAAQLLAYFATVTGTGSGLFRFGALPALHDYAAFNETAQAIHRLWAKDGSVPEGLIYLVRLGVHNGLEILAAGLLAWGLWRIFKIALADRRDTALHVLVFLWVLGSLAYFFFGGDARQTLTRHAYGDPAFWAAKAFWYGAFSCLPFLLLALSWIPRGFHGRAFFSPQASLGLLFAAGPVLFSLGTNARLLHHGMNYVWMWIIALILLAGTLGVHRPEIRILPLFFLIGLQISGSLALAWQKQGGLTAWEKSLGAFPRGALLRGSVETYAWLDRIRAESQLQGIRPGEKVFTSNEYLASYLMNWKNPSGPAASSGARWWIHHENPLPQEPMGASKRARGFFSSLFGPPDANGGLVEPRPSGADRFKLIFSVPRPGGGRSAFYEKKG